jgi:hypothetical protein
MRLIPKVMTSVWEQQNLRASHVLFETTLDENRVHCQVFRTNQYKYRHRQLRQLFVRNGWCALSAGFHTFKYGASKLMPDTKCRRMVCA